jgi:hypothetical protein
MGEARRAGDGIVEQKPPTLLKFNRSDFSKNSTANFMVSRRFFLTDRMNLAVVSYLEW